MRCSALLADVISTAIGLSMAQAGNRVIKVYNWTDYISGTTADFEKKTDIKVSYDVFGFNDTFDGKLATGQSGCDVVVPPTTFRLSRYVPARIRNWMNPSCRIWSTSL